MDLRTFQLTVEGWINLNHLNVQISGVARVFNGSSLVWSASLIHCGSGVIPKPTKANFQSMLDLMKSLTLQNFSFYKLCSLTFIMGEAEEGRWQVQWHCAIDSDES